MAWTDPKTWTPTLVRAADFNEQIRDNLNALKAPPSDDVLINEGSDYTTTSATFVDVDATDLALTITTTGGDVLLIFSCTLSNNTADRRNYIDITEDGVRLGGDDGLLVLEQPSASGGRRYPAWLYYLHTPATPGTYEYRIQWKTNSNTLTMFAGAGTANSDLHPVFIAREIS